MSETGITIKVKAPPDVHSIGNFSHILPSLFQTVSWLDVDRQCAPLGAS